MTATEERFLALERELASLSDRVSRLEGANPNLVGAPSPAPISLNEMLKQKNPTSDVQRLLVVGYFLHRQGMGSFNLSDLVSAFSRAKVGAPTNPNDAVNKNIRKGLMEEVEAKKDGLKAWRLTGPVKAKSKECREVKDEGHNQAPHWGRGHD